MKRISLILAVLVLFTLSCSLFGGDEAETQASDSPAREFSVDLLVNAKDISGFSDDIGIVQWELDDEMLGEFALCRMFTGQSQSVSPNTAMNCVNKVHAGNSFEDIMKSLYDAEILFPSDIELTPILKYNNDFAIYTHQAESGHSVYDAFLLDGEMLFRASVTVATPVGSTPETLFDANGKIIEAFLRNILMINLK